MWVISFSVRYKKIHMWTGNIFMERETMFWPHPFSMLWFFLQKFINPKKKSMFVCPLLYHLIYILLWNFSIFFRNFLRVFFQYYFHLHGICQLDYYKNYIFVCLAADIIDAWCQMCVMCDCSCFNTIFSSNFNFSYLVLVCCCFVLSSTGNNFIISWHEVVC